jgi:TAG lipase/steryl ester hydrolase/phospholipase A2/LPA acyltransferase
MLMARNVHGEAQPYLPTRRWVDGSIADDLPAKRLSRLYSTNHYIVSMVNPMATPFLSGGRERSQMARALGALGIGVGREVLNFYRGMAQRQGDTWPRFNMLMNGVHALIDQEYSGDINIIPSFRWYNPAKILSHLSEKELMDLMEGGERSAYPRSRRFAPARASRAPWRRFCTASSTAICGPRARNTIDRGRRGDARARPAPTARRCARPGPAALRGADDKRTPRSDALPRRRGTKTRTTRPAKRGSSPRRRGAPPQLRRRRQARQETRVARGTRPAANPASAAA